MDGRGQKEQSNQIMDREDSSIAEHIEYFLANIKHQIPLRSVISAAATESPESTLPLLTQASKAVAEQIRKVQVLRSLAQHYGTPLPKPLNLANFRAAHMASTIN